jgi:alpha-amylase
MKPLKAHLLFLGGGLLTLALSACQTPASSSNNPVSTTEASSESSVSSGLLSSSEISSSEDTASHNEEGSVGYEIFVGSFCDSNGDGIGDFKGILSKLDYLQTLGVHTLWLSPIMPSTSYHKYNVDNYFAVDSSFGTLADFDELVSAAHQKGFKLILDMMFNHSSDKNQFFLDSATDYANENTSSTSKKDWYVWSATDQTGYSYSSLAGAYYEANFSSNMPEFNLDNPAVVDEIHQISSFWIKDHNVDGFRLDAVLYYYYLASKQDGDHTKNIAFLTSLQTYLKTLKSDVYTVGEAWTYDQDTIAAYYASGMHFFNFPTSETHSGGMAEAVQSLSGLNYFASGLPKAETSAKEKDPNAELCYFVSNHDMDRWGNYFSVKNDPLAYKKFCASLYLWTPGTPWMYYGEEILMKGNRGATSSDALRRTGMVWGQGISRCKTFEGLTDTANNDTVGALDALDDPTSFLSHERRLIRIRNRHNDLFQKGDFTDLLVYKQTANTALKNSVIGFEIRYGNDSYYLFHNKANAEKTVVLEKSATLLEDSQLSGMSSLSGTNLTLAPYGSVLLKIGA